MEKKESNTINTVDAVKAGATELSSKIKKFAQKDSTQEAVSKMKSLYIVDLLIRLFKTKNIAALIYLALNIAFVMGIFYFLSNSVGGAFIGLGIYLVCVCITLSPVGEFILRLTHKCMKIEDTRILSRLEPLFNEVYSRAKTKQTNYVINPKVKLYINDDSEPNAFALGRSTICVTEGLLNLPDDQIKAILGHEIGHLANHDTDLILLITVGNFLVSAFITIIRIVLLIYQVVMGIVSIFLGREGIVASILMSIYSILITVCINAVMWIWTQIGVLLVMKSSRSQEYAADSFSCELGYAEPLIAFFEMLCGPKEKDRTKKKLGERLKEESGLFAILMSSHPTPQKRIDAIKKSFKIVETE